MLRGGNYCACSTTFFSDVDLWLWVLAPVRNCALGRDDTVVMAAVLTQITTTFAPTPTRP
jgi:hypothetical protein